MKTLIILAQLFVGASLLQAYWNPRSVEELVLQADVIAVAEFQGFDEIELGEDLQIQEARFRLDHVIKGEISTAFTVRGNDWGWCAPVVDFTTVERGLYLMVLTTADEGWFPADAFVVRIQNGALMWPVSRQGERKSKNLKSVERSIRRILKKGPNQTLQTTRHGASRLRSCLT
jgi:hypothetical protein